MIKPNLIRISKTIEAAAKRSGRSFQDIRLICVTKNANIQQIREAIASGITDIGENKVGDALLKYNQLGDAAGKIKWHMIGHLQTNKVKASLGIFDTIHSLDSLKLAFEIDKRAEGLKKKIPCLVEVNTSGEISKYGVRPDEVENLLGKVSNLPNIYIIGLMTMAPIVKDPKKARPYFIQLRQVKDKINSLRIPNIDLKELSMGMTQDFEIAIEEGATMVRIGTAIFAT
jgi:pyridoxal phosphate enzyme (YggS family)